MNNKKPQLEEILGRASRPVLRPDENERTWEAISGRIGETVETMGQKGILSPIQLRDLLKKPMFMTLALFLTIALAGGGTAFAANGARPGDALFGIDTAVEKVRVALASDEKKDELRIKFAGERVQEIESIIADDRGVRTEAETESEIVLSDDTKVRAAAGMDAALEMLGKLSAEADAAGRTEVSLKLDEVSKLLDSVRDDARLESDGRTDVRVESDNGEFTVKIDGETVETDDDGTTEVKNGGNSVKIEVGGNGIKVESRSNASGADGRDGEDGKDGTDGKDGEDGAAGKSSVSVSTTVVTGESTLTEAEARVGKAGTSVEIEINDSRTEFTTSATAREDIISEILKRFPMTTRSQVNSKLRIESDGWTSDDNSAEESDSQSSSKKGSSNSGGPAAGTVNDILDGLLF